jgi:hypothetical protein
LPRKFYTSCTLIISGTSHEQKEGLTITQWPIDFISSLQKYTCIPSTQLEPFPNLSWYFAAPHTSIYPLL